MSLVYEVTVPPIPAGEGPVDVFVPLAPTDEHQEVLDRRVEATIPGVEGTESRYGNGFWRGHLDASDGEPIKVSVRYVIRRAHRSNTDWSLVSRETYTEEEQARWRPFLDANERVPVDGELVDSIVATIAPGETDLVAIARATYDYVVDHMEYKKVGTGWGNGDTYWACTERYGNCTDFHALFNSLARARGIPARFGIGFTVPVDRPSGRLGGYHCWDDFYLPDIGWVPIDASEANKHPEKRDQFFGTHPTDRVLMTTGRDLQLGEGHTAGALNYFVHPHVEVGGKVRKDVELLVTFEDCVAPCRP